MRATLLTLILLPLSAFAQSWCPPGAEWHVTTNGFAHEGYLHRVYAGDTLFQGRIAQRITQAGHYYDYWSTPPTYHEVADTIHTSLDGDVLLLWLGPTIPEWDTLIWFGAVPGDRWYGPGTHGFCGAYPRGIYEVTDTSTTTVFGMPLRRVGITGFGPDGEINGWTHYFHERIGLEFGTFLLPDACLIVDGHEILRCYSDDDFSYVAPNWSFACNSAVNVNEHGTISATPPFPNPGTSYFTLSGVEGSLLPGPHTITLVDATGRMVLQQRFADERPVIGTEHLPEGLYRITVQNDQGGLTGATWVKER